ncbi:hypothetical protein IFM89_030387 [Coptis chinensis]|uniref:FBD domain-containing protein n=1 Tax=Coptis chinensis TaxID=261450 RepID=A0A835GYW5_9MAGN|nr:hypothetical protein IFM89_030387 [Coptis chinensis]
MEKSYKMERYRDQEIHTAGYNDALINLYRMSWILTPAASNDENVRVSKEGDPENRHVRYGVVLEELNGQSMLKCLRKVEIKYFGGSGSELDLVRFLLGNGSVMKEMDITYSPHKRTDKASRTFLNGMVLAFTKVSPDVAISFS